MFPLFFFLFFFLIFPYANDNRCRRVPYATPALIALNCLIYGMDLWASKSGYGTVSQYWAYVPGESAWPTMLLSAFAHAGLLHLAFNMWFLHLVGGQIEERMGSIGFVVFYLAGAVCSSFGHWIIVQVTLEHTLAPAGLIGASGAIYAVLGAYLILYPFEDFRFWYFVLYRAGTIQIATLFFLGYKILVDVTWAYIQLHYGVLTGVAHWAHLGGLVFGVATALAVFGPYAWTGGQPPSREEMWRWRLMRKVARRRFYSDLPLPQPMTESEVELATDDMDPIEGIRRGIFFHNGRILDWAFQEMLLENPKVCLEPPLMLDLIVTLKEHGRDGLAQLACWNLVEAHPQSPEAIQARFELARSLAKLPEMKSEVIRLLKEFLAASPALREKIEAEKMLTKLEERPLWQWKS
jgi:membrane associated rhomboid family serine protease